MSHAAEPGPHGTAAALGGAARARKADVGVELRRLRCSLERWHQHRTDEDALSQYTSQLTAVRTLLEGAIEEVEAGLRDLDASRTVGEVYEDCRLFDLRLVWLMLVWDFFRAKFDQRDDTAMDDVLRAADEVVWSCHHGAVERARNWGLSLATSTPAPLPFVEARYSPEAFPAELVPASLRGQIDTDFLQEHLDRLPIPVVRLQPACAASPWLLVLLGHEIGHTVQYDFGLVARSRTLVEEVVGARAPERETTRWGAWSREIFADVFSVLTMGASAVWAMVQLELQSPAGMVRRRRDYPSPVIRLVLLRTVADRLAIDAREAVEGLDLEGLVAGDDTAAADAALVPAVAEAMLDGTSLGLPGSLQDLLGFRAEDFAPRGTVEELGDGLLGDGDPPVVASLSGARLVTSAALAAWVRVREDGSARARLAERVLTSISASRDEGVRAGAEADGDVRDLGKDLGRRLLALGRDDLGIAAP
jgi:hypothetical protein